MCQFGDFRHNLGDFIEFVNWNYEIWKSEKVWNLKRFFALKIGFDFKVFNLVFDILES